MQLFGLIFFRFLEQDRLLFAIIKIGVTKFPAKKPKKWGGGLRFYSKVGAHPCKMSYFFGRGKTIIFGQGV
tara:strand:+ start:885 stop:1097 length:213 start_codon:yes stop_codon:yes gene_type:complete